MSEHIETRKKITEIAEVDSFNDLINKSTLSPTDKQIITLHYLNGHDFCFIADRLGFSESTIKRRHKKSLAKLAKLL